MNDDYSREEKENAARKLIKKNEDELRTKAEKKFKERADLEEMIIQKVLPALVSVDTATGYGMGFFQHPSWFVSNAHVTPYLALLNSATFTDYKSNKIEFVVQHSFHRPWDNNIAPDIVIANLNLVHKCLPMDLKDKQAGLIEGSYYFYIDLNNDKDYIDLNNHKYLINYLDLVPEDIEKSPLRFRCKDPENVPLPGSSGTPIIKARLSVERDPKWLFDVAGVLYARSAIINEDKERLIYAIPVDCDFKQISQILNFNENAERAQQMAYCAKACIKGGEKQAELLCQEKDEYTKLAEKKLYAFEAGETPLNIDISEELEKLVYRWSHNYYGINRPGRPKTDDYKPNENHANHHIIPIHDLLYLWDYLYHLDENTVSTIRADTNEKIKNWASKKIKKMDNNINNDYEGSIEKQNKRLSDRKDLNIEKNKKQKEIFEDYVNSKLEASYGRFYTLLKCLTSSDKWKVDRCLFAWSWWNLFQGPTATSRSDDPKNDRHDKSEKNKPSSFNQEIWSCLKDDRNGLYKHIQDLKNHRSKNTIENLHSVMKKLSLACFKSKQKVPHPYCEKDWEPPSERSGLTKLK